MVLQNAVFHIQREHLCIIRSIFNAVIVGAVLGDMPHAMMIGASLQLIYLGVIAAGGNQPTDPCLAAYVAIPVAMASGLNTNAAVALAVPVGPFRSSDFELALSGGRVLCTKSRCLRKEKVNAKE